MCLVFENNLTKFQKISVNVSRFLRTVFSRNTLYISFSTTGSYFLCQFSKMDILPLSGYFMYLHQTEGHTQSVSSTYFLITDFDFNHWSLRKQETSFTFQSFYVQLPCFFQLLITNRASKIKITVDKCLENHPTEYGIQVYIFVITLSFITF